MATTDAPPSLPQTRPSADSRTDLIEQIFQKVEEETERRAQEQLEFEEQAAQSRVASPAPQAVPPAAPAAVSVVPVRDGPRDRRRGSISISRFGQATDLTTQTNDSPSALPSRTNSVIINAGKTGAFYQAQKYAGSADSFADSLDGGHAHEDAREEEGVTQMETIAGKVSIGKAVGGLIARRLSRSRTRSRDILATPSGLVIGVSVEETEVEHGEDEADALDKPTTPHGTSFVYAQADGLRSRRSTVSMPGTGSSNTSESATGVAAGAGQERRLSAAGWVAKAKDLTKKFRRKSMAVLPQNSSP
ncbi:hypothetical protein C8Q79DRAFT_744395 [Trametes meyenii]|nr:hypothetical protein C8Q79DRAFT_744395 [Trametes meyenii]